MITDDHLPALQGMFPSWITTVSNDGEPNTTVISQIWHVNETEVALSFQFFNKTKKNISQNPFAFATITNPASFDMYTLELEYSRTENEGDLFDDLDRMDREEEALRRRAMFHVVKNATIKLEGFTNCHDF